MERLYIEQTKGTPQIDFNPEKGFLSIKGQSYPENAFKFYEPVLNWVDDYLNQVGQEEITIDMEFALPYINTSSSKCIFMLIERLEDGWNNGRNIKINWYYDEENESSLECAEEFKEDMTLPFNIIPILNKCE